MQMNPWLVNKKNLAIKSSLMPIIWEKFSRIKAFKTKNWLKHKYIHVKDKFSIKESNTAILWFNGPITILQLKIGVQIVLFRIIAYPNWMINWFFKLLFKGSPPYFSNIETEMLKAFVKVIRVKKIIPAITVKILIWAIFKFLFQTTSLSFCLSVYVYGVWFSVYSW